MHSASAVAVETVKDYSSPGVARYVTAPKLDCDWHVRFTAYLVRVKAGVVTGYTPQELQMAQEWGFIQRDLFVNNPMWIEGQWNRGFELRTKRKR